MKNLIKFATVLTLAIVSFSAWRISNRNTPQESSISTIDDSCPPEFQQSVQNQTFTEDENKTLDLAQSALNDISTKRNAVEYAYRLDKHKVLFGDFNHDALRDLAVMVVGEIKDTINGKDAWLYVFQSKLADNQHFDLISSPDYIFDGRGYVESLSFESGDTFIVNEVNHGENSQDFGYCPKHRKTLKLKLITSHLIVR